MDMLILDLQYISIQMQNSFNKPLEDLKDDEILDYLQKRDLSICSKKTILAVLKSFFAFCRANIERGISIEEIRQELTIRQRYDKIINLKIPHFLKGNAEKEKQRIYLNDLKKILSVADKKDRDIIILLSYFGFRKSELLGIKFENINFNENKIRIQTAKTKIWRNLYFINKIKPILRRFMMEYKHNLRYDSINSFLLKYRHIIGFRIYPHLFRHLFNTEMRKQLNNDYLIKKLMGHSNKDMTDLYTDVSEEEIKEAMQKKHYLKQYLEAEL